MTKPAASKVMRNSAPLQHKHPSGVQDQGQLASTMCNTCLCMLLLLCRSKMSTGDPANVLMGSSYNGKEWESRLPTNSPVEVLSMQQRTPILGQMQAGKSCLYVPVLC